MLYNSKYFVLKNEYILIVMENMFYAEIPVNPEVELLCKIRLTCDNLLNYDFANSCKLDSENENSIHYKIYVKMMFMFLDNLPTPF